MHSLHLLWASVRLPSRITVAPRSHGMCSALLWRMLVVVACWAARQVSCTAMWALETACWMTCGTLFTTRPSQSASCCPLTSLAPLVRREGGGKLSHVARGLSLTQHALSAFLTPELVNEGLKWIAAGGNLDFSAGSHVIAALKAYHASNASALDHVSISSDAYGSLPHYDPSGALESYSYASPGMLLGVVQDMVLLEEWPLEQVLPTVTRNPALFTGLADKGELKVGHDGDIVLLSQPNVKEEKGLEMQYVIARGMIAATPHCVAKGLFE